MYEVRIYKLGFHIARVGREAIPKRQSQAPEKIMSTNTHLEEIQSINTAYMNNDYWGSMNEEISIALYMAVLQPGDVAIDCGVNRGDHTKVMARRCGPEGRVYSFEAAPKMMAKAQESNQGFSNIKWIERAVSNVGDQEIDFFFYPNEDGLSGIKPGANVSVCVPVKTLTTTIDAEVEGQVSLIKLDIEGGEYHALLGANRVMKESRPVIIFENGRAAAAEKFGYTKADFFRLFRDHGYNLYAITGMPFTEELWDDVMHPWQFIALHPENPRLGRAFAVTNTYLSYLAGFPGRR